MSSQLSPGNDHQMGNMQCLWVFMQLEQKNNLMTLGQSVNVFRLLSIHQVQTLIGLK